MAGSVYLNTPSGCVVSPSGVVYWSEHFPAVIRKYDPATNMVSYVAGVPNSPGYTGIGGLALNAALDMPRGLALLPNGVGAAWVLVAKGFMHGAC